MSKIHPFSAFRDSLAGRDAKTIKTYLSVLHLFLAWLEQQPDGYPFAPDKITTTTVSRYMEHLTKSGKAARTRSLSLSTLRQYCGWAIKAGYLQHNPAREVAMPSIIHTAPRELTPEQRYAVRTQVEMVRSVRLSAIFALGYWTGLRISEIATLQVEHVTVNQTSGCIKVVDSKGRKSRELDLHSASRRALQTYFAAQERDPDSRFVFTSQRAGWLRQQGKPDHLSARGIDFMWAKMKANAPYKLHAFIQDITMHDLRHDFAHRARQSGWNLEEIAVYLGHQTKSGTPAISTTVRYTRPSRKQFKQRLKTLGG